MMTKFELFVETKQKEIDQEECLFKKVYMQVALNDFIKKYEKENML